MGLPSLLQWDRAFDGAESFGLILDLLQLALLQWDRAFDGAESGINLRHRTRLPGFNGTAPLMARNRGGGKQVGRAGPASMGPRL